MAEECASFPMVLRSGRSADELRRLVKARRLLAAAVDNHRAIAGAVSPAWLLSEAERRIPWERLPPILQRRFQPASGPPPKSINTNWLPKLEPELNAHILASVVLFGARLFGRGTPDPGEGIGFQEIDNDLIIAAMIHQSFGLRDTYSAFLPERHRVVDEEYLTEEFGDGVLMRVWALREQLALFEMALRSGGRVMPEFPVEYANAIAAVKTANLRLTARAAGDGIFAFLDDAKREELRAKGIDPGEPGSEFPERRYLERDYLAAKAALALPGVDNDTVREPARDVLLRSVEHVLYHGTPPTELVGKYGSAIRNFHCALPLWDHYSPINRRTVEGGAGEQVEIFGPFALGTLYVTSLEVTRYLVNVRRKGGRTGAGHSFLVSARVEHLLGLHVSVPVLAGSDCHDVVEDGGFAVTGYDQNLELFASRLGAPLAALVAEVTDSFAKEDGPVKAAATGKHPCLVPMEKAYNLGQLAELRSRATDPDMPYTLQGIIMKIADFGATQEEGLHDPDLMMGAWRHSGARFSWDHYSKGRILRPLLERLRVEILINRTDPFYLQRDGSLPSYLVERLRTVLSWSFETADLYAAQNLAILAAEYGMDEEQRKALLALFFGEEERLVDPATFLERLLDDSRLDHDLRRKGLSAAYRLVPDGAPVRDTSRLVDYWAAARWRRAVRVELDLRPLSAGRVEEMLQRWDASVGTRAFAPRPT
jgi:hypothetical protein